MDRHGSDARAETRLSGELAHRFDTYREESGAGKSEVLREALDEFLPESEVSKYLLPNDPELVEPYLTLAGDEKRNMSVERVESILAEQTHPNTSKELIRENVLKPLDNTGFLGISGGVVGIHPLTPHEAVSE
jgi:predicted DNA-binding protein